ncbi:hypothetical protein BJ322DRAFT_1022918 [Thelephora terrestris]|uniref:Uncharacterized protein n=1 Tax=Thelephora terrestris TaxID=56493 RepID=A0A9P6H820_9AGAM|nr:hypothetical protein BJ322DRAFT_1022918 [Thelephora terrestris]
MYMIEHVKPWSFVKEVPHGQTDELVQNKFKTYPLIKVWAKWWVNRGLLPVSAHSAQSPPRLRAHHFQGRYSSNKKLVVFMDCSLQHISEEDDEHFTGLQATADTIEFLEANPYTKIMAKDTNGNYQACSLLEILQDCSCKDYMSDEEDAPSHHHKMLIMNLACGALVSLPQLRGELLTGEVTPVLLPLISDWVQTSSDYEVLIAKPVPAGWAHRNHPVLFRHGHDPSCYNKFKSTEKPCVNVTLGKDDHILHIWFNLSQPGVRIVRCFCGCEKGIDSKPAKNTDYCPSIQFIDRNSTGKVFTGCSGIPAGPISYPHWDPTNADNDQLQSISLPLMTSTGPTTPMQPRLPTFRIPPQPLGQGSPTIQIPSWPLGQGSLTAVESRRAGTRSATTTPPKLQKRPQSKPPEPAPSLSDLVSRMWKKRPRLEDDHPPTPPTF